MSELTPAPKGHPIKLVRDRTPNVVNASGDPGDLFYGRVSAAEAEPWLRKKLVEEVAEFVVDGGIEELADVQAVVDGLAATLGFSPEAVRHLVEKDERGGFYGNVMMYGYHAEFDGRQG